MNKTSKLITEEYKQDGESYERTKTLLSKDLNSDRGLGIIQFTDRSHNECSLQDSSLATEPAIWLGINEAKGQSFTPGRGWEPFHIPKETVIPTRMQLTQTMVKQLLPYLQEFAKTGEYVANMKLETKAKKSAKKKTKKKTKK